MAVGATAHLEAGCVRHTAEEVRVNGAVGVVEVVKIRNVGRPLLIMHMKT